jgi:hypothetical protein
MTNIYKFKKINQYNRRRIYNKAKDLQFFHALLHYAIQKNRKKQ